MLFRLERPLPDGFPILIQLIFYPVEPGRMQIYDLQICLTATASGLLPDPRPPA